MSDSNSAANALVISVFAVLVGVPWCNNDLRSRCAFELAIASCSIFVGTSVCRYWSHFNCDCSDAIASKHRRPAREVAHSIVISRLQITLKEIPEMVCSTFDFLNAAAYGTTEEVRAMLDAGIDVNVRNEGSRETALMTAAGGGNVETVKLLIDRGADINAKSFEGGTALLVAIDRKQDNVVECLLLHGANPNDKLAINPGLTALCMAAQRGYLRILKALLRAGADPDKRAGDGSTALVNAAFKGHDDVARELIESGADKRAKTAGMTAEEFAERFGYSSTATVMRETPQGCNKQNVGSPTSTGCLIPLLIGMSAIMCVAIAIVTA